MVIAAYELGLDTATQSERTIFIYFFKLSYSVNSHMELPYFCSSYKAHK